MSGFVITVTSHLFLSCFFIACLLFLSFLLFFTSSLVVSVPLSVHLVSGGQDTDQSPSLSLCITNAEIMRMCYINLIDLMRFGQDNERSPEGPGQYCSDSLFFKHTASLLGEFVADFPSR